MFSIRHSQRHDNVLQLCHILLECEHPESTIDEYLWMLTLPVLRDGVPSFYTTHRATQHEAGDCWLNFIHTDWTRFHIPISGCDLNEEHTTLLPQESGNHELRLVSSDNNLGYLHISSSNWHVDKT